jgi:hypothetical protein
MKYEVAWLGAVQQPRPCVAIWPTEVKDVLGVHHVSGSRAAHTSVTKVILLCFLSEVIFVDVKYTWRNHFIVEVPDWNLIQATVVRWDS